VPIPIDLRALRRWDETKNDYQFDAVPRELLAGPASDCLPLALTLSSLGT
jgi:hypothetical protein